MKKSIFGLFALLALVLSCQKSDNRGKLPATSSMLSVTLNGIDKDVAMEMIQHFGDLRLGDSTPVKTNVWFDRTTVERIFSLVKSEGGDGIRIYFISNLNVNGPHLKNSIALVSTKANGENPLALSGMRHKDYYDHAADNPLFSNLKGIIGSVTYGDESRYAALNKTCNTCELEIQNSTGNPHHITRQVAEQMVQHFGSHPISTISEWFDLGLFGAITKDKNYDGIRIYFGTKPVGLKQSGSDAFVIIKTTPGPVANSHTDYFGNSINNFEIADGGQDDGELCPDVCN